ncbi:MAG: hypothetical protein ABIZ91_09525 [Gemmatimonadaceae bacterium]
MTRSAFISPTALAMYTRPPATAGEAVTGAPIADRQRSAPLCSEMT